MNLSKSETRVITSAPGKVILTGEHFVVHGSYAVAAAINKRAKVIVSSSGESESEILSENVRSPVQREDGLFKVIKAVAKAIGKEYGSSRRNFRIQVSSEIPENSGLGSSSAVAVATAAGLFRYIGHSISKREIWKMSTEGEKSVHGNPSGIDTKASLSGGVFLFNKKRGMKAIRVDSKVNILVIFTGKTRRTRNLVSKVERLRGKYPGSFRHLSQAASFLSFEAARSLEKGKLPQLGDIMNLSQLSLSWIGVSTRQLDELIEDVRTREVFGAKITGAGGGGSIIVLPRPAAAEPLLTEISRKYPFSFLTTIPQEGLRWESQSR